MTKPMTKTATMWHRNTKTGSIAKVTAQLHFGERDNCVMVTHGTMTVWVPKSELFATRHSAKQAS